MSIQFNTFSNFYFTNLWFCNFNHFNLSSEILLLLIGEILLLLIGKKIICKNNLINNPDNFPLFITCPWRHYCDYQMDVLLNAALVVSDSSLQVVVNNEYVCYNGNPFEEIA